MERSVEIVSAEAIKELIARSFLVDEAPIEDSSTERPGPTFFCLGNVRLRPHQISAIRRIHAALNEFGGALLCDEVGMGKTFVALAVAQHFKSPIIVGPAVLRDMWSSQEELSGTTIPFLSLERMSRVSARTGEFDLVVIDEAHHFRNPCTRRFRELSRLTANSRVLMLSATPVHNRRNDLITLLSIFLGSRAESLTASEIPRCLVRRQIESSALSAEIPQAHALLWKELDDDGQVPRALLSLPPPVPPSDGGDAGILVARSLIRQWCSSDAALIGALRRRLGKAIALISAIESGHYPSRSELAAWTIADDSMQLAFPSLVATQDARGGRLLEALRAHQDGIEMVLRSVATGESRDSQRAALLSEIRRAHPGTPVVAFSQYAETVNALFAHLRTERGVAALTSRGAKVAGGPITRGEAISRFAPRASGVQSVREAERVTLLLTTDLLSEGVNLQDAGVVVHLDLPWTPARLEQRVGRVARLGSAYTRVYSYGIRPSRAAEVLIRLERTIEKKMREAESTVGAFRRLLPDTAAKTRAPNDPSSASEAIRVLLRKWRGVGGLQMSSQPPDQCDRIRAATTSGRSPGFIALCVEDHDVMLLASDTLRVWDSPVRVLEVLRSVERGPVQDRPQHILAAIRIVESYWKTRHITSLTDDSTSSVAQARKAVLERIARIVETARPQQRSRIVKLGDKARGAVFATLSLWEEMNLVRFASAELPDEQWLRQLANQAETRLSRSSGAVTVRLPHPPRVVAILLIEPEPSIRAGEVTSLR
jgi:superfamily II DNA or RNA helicase